MKEIEEAKDLFSQELLEALSKKGGQVGIALCIREGLSNSERTQRYNAIRATIAQDKKGHYSYPKQLISYYAYAQFKSYKCAKVALEAFGYSKELYAYLKVLKGIKNV